MNFTNSRAKNLLDILLSVKKGKFFLINLFFQKYVFKLKNQIIFFCFHFLLNCRESRIPHPLRNQPEPTPKTLKKKKKKLGIFQRRNTKKKNIPSVEIFPSSFSSNLLNMSSSKYPHFSQFSSKTFWISSLLKNPLPSSSIFLKASIISSFILA